MYKWVTECNTEALYYGNTEMEYVINEKSYEPTRAFRDLIKVTRDVLKVRKLHHLSRNEISINDVGVRCKNETFIFGY